MFSENASAKQCFPVTNGFFDILWLYQKTMATLFHFFFIYKSNTFISKASLKLAKKIKQMLNNTETELLLIEI